MKGGYDEEARLLWRLRLCARGLRLCHGVLPVYFKTCFRKNVSNIFYSISEFLRRKAALLALPGPRLFPCLRPDGAPFRTFCRIFLWAGLALAAAYAVCAACWFAGVQVWFVRPALRLAEYAAPAFLIPGVLIGAGLEKAE